MNCYSPWWMLLLFLAVFCGTVALAIYVDGLHAQGAFGKTRAGYLFAKKLRKGK